MKDDECIESILNYWFGELDQRGVCQPQQQQLWFQSRPETDALIRHCYGEPMEQALAGGLDHWRQSPAGLMALVLLLDQFTRNCHRGTPQAFAGDARALKLVQDAVSSGIDRSMPTIHRVFLYIPYEHAEDLQVQEQGISLFDRLLEDCNEQVRNQVDGFRDYSVAHRDVIERFGRFPHRNKILGRESSPAEHEHLKKHGGF